MRRSDSPTLRKEAVIGDIAGMPAGSVGWCIWCAIHSGVCAAALSACLAVPGTASADRAFSARFSTNTQGDIAIAANSIESCLDSLAVCADVRNAVGGAVAGNNNNSRTMTWIDADGDPSTFDSSSSNLTLPAGASVLFAGLYYGGRLAAGSGGSPAPNPGARNTVLLQGPGRHGLSLADGVAGRRFLDPVPGVRQRHGDRRGGRRGDVLDGERAARHGAERFELWWLGAGRRLRGSGRAEPQPVGVRRAAERQRHRHGHDSAERVSDAAVGSGDLDGRARRLRGRSGDDGRRRADPGRGRGFTALSNAVNPANNVFNSTISNAGALVTVAHAELSEQPRLRRGPVQDDERARQRADEHAGQAVDQRRRLPAGRGDARDRPVRAEDHRDEDRRSRHGESRRHADLHGGDAEHRPGRRGRHDVHRSDPAREPCSSRAASASTARRSATRAGDDLGEFAGGRVVVRLGTGATAGGGRHARSGRERDGELPGHGRHGGAGVGRDDRATPRTSRSEPRRPGSRAR